MNSVTGVNLNTILNHHEKVETNKPSTLEDAVKTLTEAHEDRAVLMAEVKRLRAELESYDMVSHLLEREKQEHDETRGYRQLAEQDRDDALLELEKLKNKVK